nr:MAG TPA: hypothetical protein [Bacteriophage sp.]
MFFYIILRHVSSFHILFYYISLFINKSLTLF